MSKVLMLLCAVLFNAVTGGTLAMAAGLDPMTGMIGMNAVGVAVGMAGGEAQGALRAGVLTEVWTGELVKSLRAGLEGTWLDGIPDQSSLVDNDVIHLVEVGVDPDVLVNNTTYPIELQKLDDKDITISLDKFQSKPTPITDDELYALSYDKMSRVKESHSNAITDTKFQKAAHALAPAKDSTSTPVIATTGEDDGTGRKRLVVADLVTLKAKLDKLKVPASGRRLVLCPDHVNDLLLTNQTFERQYNINRNDGTVGKLEGFEIYEFVNNPYYTTAGVKGELGSTDGYQGSFCFYVPRVFKATGSTKVYYSEAATDPQNQRALIAFRHYFICLHKKEDACGAIYSAAAA